MDTIASGFEHLSFHDTSVDKIIRAPSSITIDFSGAFLSKGHPSAHGSEWYISSGTLILSGVTGEEALFWQGDKVSRQHPEPEFPLDEIMHASFDGILFAFDGLLKHMPWYEWFVVANGFNLVPRDVTRVS